MGTSPEAIDLAEDRERFSAVLDELDITYPAAGMATGFEEAERVTNRMGFPAARSPELRARRPRHGIAYDPSHLRTFMAEATRISPDHPVYLDRFLEGAIECDVDALCDGEQVYVGGVLEHIEEARYSLGRLGHLHSAVLVQRPLGRRAARHHASPGAAPGRARPTQCAVRH